jgi:hypothetical protein
MAVTIVADQGSHLLISQDGRCAIVERRNNRLYNCHDETRDGIPLDRISEIGLLLQPGDWKDQASAQAEFDEVVARGRHLSERML